MSKRYFLSRQGQQVGPYTVNEILEKLETGEHVWNDYIYNESKEDWILLLEHPLLAEKYNQGWGRGHGQPETATHPFYVKKWLLQKDNKNFGPFSFLEIIQMLQERTIHVQDMLTVVNSGKWARVKEYSEFSAQKVRELVASSDRHIKEIFNRRRYPRVEYDGTLIVHDNKTVFRGQSFQLSVGGAGLYIPSSGLQPGQTLLLHFHPSPDVPAFNAVAAVVSKTAPSKESTVQPLRYGVKFTSISQPIKDRIFSYTNKKKDAA